MNKDPKLQECVTPTKARQQFTVRMHAPKQEADKAATDVALCSGYGECFQSRLYLRCPLVMVLCDFAKCTCEVFSRGHH
eukprot:5449650-Amphidinium_carterae.1